MEFSNEQVFTKELPGLKEVKFEKLEERYFQVLLYSRLLFAFFVIAFFVAAAFLIPGDIPSIYYWLSATLISILLLLFLAFTGRVFKIKAYGIRQHDIIYKSGLIFRSLTIVPFNRVQHVEIKTGPIDRLFKVSSLKIFTAGGSQSDLSIPGLSQNNSQAIKEIIISKRSRDEEE